MNKDDGTWRFIYVGPNGQLIGRIRQVSLLQSILSTLQPPLAWPLARRFIADGQQWWFAGPWEAAWEPRRALPRALRQALDLAPHPAPRVNPANPPTARRLPTSLESQPQPLQGAVIGGNIIGVGSKIKQPSLRVYEGGESYAEWEFIWNPTQQVAIPGQKVSRRPGCTPLSPKRRKRHKLRKARQTRKRHKIPQCPLCVRTRLQLVRG